MAGRRIRIEAQTWADGAKSAVAINGEQVWFSYQRGVNLMRFDPATGGLSEISNFDTFISTAEADRLAHAINAFPVGTVIIGTTLDEPTTCLNDSAKAALLSLGVDTAGVPYRGTFAFVAVKGYNDQTKMVKGAGNTALEVTIAAGRRIRIEACTWGQGATSNVTIDGKPVWSTAQRGVNIARFDPATGGLSEMNGFDTFASAGEADRLARAINAFPVGTVIIGTTLDEPTQCLNDAARAALLSLGVDTTGVPYRGTFAFVAVKGYNDRTKLVKGAGNTVLEVNFAGAGAAENITFVLGSATSPCCPVVITRQT